MSHFDDIGNLMHLYLEAIQPAEAIEISEFLVLATANLLNKTGGRNWIPVIVKETGEDQYQVIGNSFVYAVAEAAGLEKVWCIIADNNQETEELTKVLAGESIPKINLSKATRDEIKSALQYLIENPGSALKSVKLLVATNRINEASDRKYWKNLDPITQLKCGITKGAKLNALKEVFYLDPQPRPEKTTDPKPSPKPRPEKTTDLTILDKLTVPELRAMAKQKGIKGTSKKNKPELVELLSQ